MTAISTMQFEQRFTLEKNAENLYIYYFFQTHKMSGKKNDLIIFEQRFFVPTFYLLHDIEIGASSLDYVFYPIERG